MNEVEQDLLTWYTERLRPTEPLTAETDLLEEGYIDSVLMMDLIVSIEKRHGVRIENTDIAPRHFRTIAATAAFIAARQAADGKRGA